MPVFEIGLDDGRRLRIEADDQEAALSGVAHFQQQEGAKAPSGAAAGLVHGLKEVVNSNAETAKDFYGVGDGRKPGDPNYIPANITNGSFNPLKWNYSQVPQKITEQVPGLAQDIGAATLAAKVAPGSPGIKAIAGLAGGALSAFHRTAGDTAKEAAAARTGNPEAAPETQDLVKGGATAAASSAVSALTPARFLPGVGKLSTVGAQGALDAAKKYATTAAVGAGASGASDAITQVGTTIGTDKGVQFDPNRALEAAAGGGLTAAAMSTPRVIGDTTRAVSLREHGGDNLEATKNYATRLQTAGEGELGKTIGGGKRDYQAHETVKTDLKNELRDAAKAVRDSGPLHPEVDNALQRAQDGKPLSERDIALIDNGVAQAPAGANAAFLARTMHMAQKAEGHGSFDTGGHWSGGISGVMDKNLGFMMNPVRLAGGTIATAMGMHLLGLSNPMFAGSVAGGYGAARVIDQMNGTRSPAQKFAEHFADHAATLRLPNAPQAPAAPSGPAPTGPWGPRPQQTVPNIAPPQQSAPQPSFNPLALKMMQQKLRTGLPPEAAPAGPEMPAINPVALKMTQQAMKQGLPQPAAPSVAPAPEPAPQFTPSPMAVSMLKQKLKQGLTPEAHAENTPAIAAQPAENTAVPKDVAAAAKALMGAKANVEKIKARSSEPTAKISKKNGKVESDDPYASRSPYEPIADERLYPHGIDPTTYAQHEADSYLGPGVPRGRRENYVAKAESTALARNQVINDMKSNFPEYAVAFDGLLRQLHKIGGKRELALDAVHHYAGLLSPQAGKALRDAFKLDRLWKD